MVHLTHYLQCFDKLVAFISRYFIGSHIFPDVLLNDIAGPEGDPLLLSLKLSVDVLVSNFKHESMICASSLLLELSACTY